LKTGILPDAIMRIQNFDEFLKIVIYQNFWQALAAPVMIVKPLRFFLNRCEKFKKDNSKNYQ